MAEPSRGDEDKQESTVGVAGGHDDEHDVGNARNRERNEGRIDDGDEEEAEESEAEEEVKERGMGPRGRDLEQKVECGTVSAELRARSRSYAL